MTRSKVNLVGKTEMSNMPNPPSIALKRVWPKDTVAVKTLTKLLWQCEPEEEDPVVLARVKDTRWEFWIIFVNGIPSGYLGYQIRLKDVLVRFLAFLPGIRTEYCLRTCLSVPADRVNGDPRPLTLVVRERDLSYQQLLRGLGWSWCHTVKNFFDDGLRGNEGLNAPTLRSDCWLFRKTSRVPT